MDLSVIILPGITIIAFNNIVGVVDSFSYMFYSYEITYITAAVIYRRIVEQIRISRFWWADNLAYLIKNVSARKVIHEKIYGIKQ